MMNDQDRDLIAALAEGRLSTEDAEAARTRIAADADLSAEYAHQVAAIDFLSTAPPAQMTPDERTALHTALVSQLGMSTAAAPAAVAKRRTPWWQPVFGLASAAAIIAAVVILPGTLSGDSSDEALITADVQRESVATEAGEESSTATTIAAASDTAAEAPEAGAAQLAAEEQDLSVYETESVDLDELLSVADGSTDSDDAQLKLARLGFAAKVDLDADQVNACIEHLNAEFPERLSEIVVIGADVEPADTIVHLGFDYGDGVEDGLSFNLGDCSLVRHSSQG